MSSLCLDASANDGLEKKEDKVIKHSKRIKKMRHLKVPAKAKTQENSTITVKKDTASPKSLKKINITSIKNNDFVEKPIISEEILRKNKIKLVNSSETNTQIEKPPTPSVESDAKNDILTKQGDNPEESTQVIKEVILIRGVFDFQNFLDSIGIAVSGKQASQIQDKISTPNDILEETKKNVNENQNQFRKENQASKELTHEERKELKNEENQELKHEESMESRNVNQRKMNGKEISGEDISRKSVYSEKNRKFEEEDDFLDEEILAYFEAFMNSPIYRRKLARKYEENQLMRKHNGNKDSDKSISSRKTEKHTIEKNRKMDKSIMKKNYDPSARKKLEKELIAEDSNYGNSRESSEVEEQINAKNIEPKSVEKYIYIEDKYPFDRKCVIKEEVITENSGSKNDHNKYTDDVGTEIIMDYIILNNEKPPSLRHLQESKEIIEETHDIGSKGLTENIC